MASSPTHSEYSPLLGDTRTKPSGDIDARQVGPLEISTTTRYLILLGVWTATFLSSANMTLVPTMLPSISSEFQKSHQASWLGTAYLLATCTFTPLYGRLSDVMGRKSATQTAVLFGGLGTIACGLSTNMEMLVASRFITGIGGGGISTMAAIVVSDMYSLRSRGLAQGIASVFNGLGFGVGGPLGGLITDWLGWRWAFLIQTPLFVLSILLITFKLEYDTPGVGKNAVQVLKRIDYLGSITLLITVASTLIFLSTRYNESLPWSDVAVFLPLTASLVFFLLFVFVEIFVAREPVLAPFLLKEKVPVLVGISNFLVSSCNFAMSYYFPMWFQTVMSTSAAIAGLHSLPSSIAMPIGSVFAGWMMHRTGKYKVINLTFGILPFIAGVLIAQLREDSGPIQSWLSITPIGFGNAVVMQTTLVALLAHIQENHMAVATGFSRLFGSLGQVTGVAVSSALFQTVLERELRKRIHGSDAEGMIKRIRQNARLIETLPVDQQQMVRHSYDVGLKAVFWFATFSTLLAYIVRLPIPEKDLGEEPRAGGVAGSTSTNQSERDASHEDH
ncbi:vacuolar amino acid permease [Gymnopus androsaceus JB14]|uniref:Vacuolar amino acid permease n=1 Tax=Gymnopus androsaceus JB14 TaxID=1447944 RepID=A0A6A4H5I0_9AGAR|nr:vacuolar amino acid permease [Gymnopus androsaceus JB14]